MTLLLIFSMPVLACLWSSETDIDGNAVSINDHPPEQWIDRLQNTGRWLHDATELAEKVRAQPTNREYRNDYGVALAQTGQVSEALKIFRDLEAEFPGQYQTAANLGTVLELSGNNEDALEWIREAIKRNPNSHRGTEWVHVKILEAKLASAKDPNWLKTHTILGNDFGSEGRPQVTGQLLDKEEMERVIRALEYQLSERMSLVSPPDVYVGDLLFDLGNLVVLTKSVERGVAVLQLSEKYGTSRPEVLRTRLEYFRSLSPGGTRSEPAKTRGLWPEAVISPLMLAPIAIVISLLVWQRRRRHHGGS